MKFEGAISFLLIKRPGELTKEWHNCLLRNVVGQGPFPQTAFFYIHSETLYFIEILGS